jgi:four helix bundle protein
LNRQDICRGVGVPSEADTLAERARQFAIRVLKFVRSLPRDPATDAVARQLARSGPGVSSNYRSARRARSRAEFIARLAVVVDEADESEHWLSVLDESELASGREREWLWQESRELLAIFSKALTTARLNQGKSSHRHILTSSHPHIVTSSHPHILKSSHPQILRFTP